MDADNSIEDNSSIISDESFYKQKDKLFNLALDTYFFTRNLKSYKNNYNKIDKNLASLLYDAVNAIDNFLKDAECQQDSDDKYNVMELVPFVESEICEAHRYYRCKPCNTNVKGSAKSFTEHFYGNVHLKNLRIYEKSVPPPKISSKGSFQSLQDTSDALSTLSTSPPKKNIPVVDTKLPKKMREFMTTGDIDAYTASLLTHGQQILKSNIHVRVCKLLQQQLAFRFPDIKAYPFGSMVIGLGKQKGDLDIFVDIGKFYFSKPSKKIMKNAIHNTKAILQSYGNSWSDFEPVVHARTPILRAYCRSVGIDCDLSFSNGLSSCNTGLIGYFVGLQPVCKKLVMFLKDWSSILQLGLNSYLISLLVIFYLQQQKLLPPVELIQSATKPVYIDGWRCNFQSLDLVQLKIPLVTDFMSHLIGFFRFYGFEFDYNASIVSVLTGYPVEKKLFDHGREENLPPVFERFKLYMAQLNVAEADEVEDLFSNHKPLVIQDPFELCHNVAKGVQAPKLLKIINYMRSAHEILVARKN